jgi:hypothetical protein
MSKGPGRIMRSINAAIAAEPKRRFTYGELAANGYGGEPSTQEQAHGRLVAVQRAVQSLVSARCVSLGVDTHSWLRTVRAFDPEARSSASIVSVASVQVPS